MKQDGHALDTKRLEPLIASSEYDGKKRSHVQKILSKQKRFAPMGISPVHNQKLTGRLKAGSKTYANGGIEPPRRWIPRVKADSRRIDSFKPTKRSKRAQEAQQSDRLKPAPETRKGPLRAPRSRGGCPRMREASPMGATPYPPTD